MHYAKSSRNGEAFFEIDDYDNDLQTGGEFSLLYIV